ASGTLGALKPPADTIAAELRVRWAATATPLALVLSPWAARAVQIEPTQLAWAAGQWMRLAVLEVMLALPFFTGGLASLTAFTPARRRTGRLYGASFGGGAFGVVLVLAALFWLTPHRSLVLPPLLGVAGALALGWRGRLAWASVAALIGAAGFLSPLWSPRLTPYKSLSQLEAMPASQRVAERTSPLGWVVAVEAPAFHLAPGLSLGFQGRLPPQVALLVDGDVAGAATEVRGPGAAELADSLPTSLPHQLRDLHRVLLLGVGEGLDRKAALTHRATRVVTLDPNPALLELARRYGPLDAADAQRTTDHAGHARTVLARTEESFDLISLAPASGHGASVGGVRALDEDFLHTVDAYVLYLRHLTPNGILCVTRWLSAPPRESARTVLTVAEALRSVGGSPASGLVLARSWGTATVLARP